MLKTYECYPYLRFEEKGKMELIYDKTNISFEGEWYWHSDSAGGRMADESKWDYSTYLNNWDGMINALRG